MVEVCEFGTAESARFDATVGPELIVVPNRIDLRAAGGALVDPTIAGPRRWPRATMRSDASCHDERSSAQSRYESAHEQPPGG